LLRDVLLDEKLVIAVECLESCHQPLLDAYLAGKMKESKFLESVDWTKHWGFPWENYRPLFELARERDYPMIALNKYYRTRTVSALAKRDRHAAGVLATTRKLHPRHLIFVLYGDLHLAESHLYGAIREEKAFAKEKILRIFLNSERLYFRQARKGLVKPQGILRSSGDRYCLLTAPPWAKWQSYLMFLEQTYDRELGESGGIDYTDHLAALIRLAGEDLGIKFKVHDIAVYSSEDRSFYLKSVRHLPRNFEKIVKRLVSSDRSFYIPRGGIFYLSRPSVNHAASLAGQYIQAKLSGRRRPAWNMPSDFLGAIWIEAASFFVSKLINPHRKSESLHLIRQELEAGDPCGRGRATLLVVLDQRMSEIIQIHSERKRPRRYRPPAHFHYIEAARILGSMMGERFFTGYKRGRFSKAQVLKLISQDVFASDFGSSYFQLVKQMESSDPEFINTTVVGKS
ncbi:MAG: ChaN family lipoprotein, partial [Bdellovibrionales bacterium]|nr:ChaN family lipoprotein [Bdellovibrionales bacterium]